MKTTVTIPGIHCESCAALIEDVSGEFPAISGVEVDLALKRVTITHDEALNFAQWKEEIESLGDTYKVQS